MKTNGRRFRYPIPSPPVNQRWYLLIVARQKTPTDFLFFLVLADDATADQNLLQIGAEEPDANPMLPSNP